MAAVFVAALMVASMVVPGATINNAAALSGGSLTASVSPTVTPSSMTPVAAPASGSPHPGVIDDYEVVPAGASTEDPAVLYDTVSEEAALNVFQTLVIYQGNSTTNFLPSLSTCVPGANCTAQYGQSLIVNNATTGQPEYYTFPIGNANFYDPGTGASWQVWPSDVMFSVARSQIWSDPSGVTGGWDTAQELLPNAAVVPSQANSSWDGGLHYPYNNTPQNSLGSMMVNDSMYCPAAAMAANGCITFNVWGGNTYWPFFMQALTQMFAGVAVLPCGWYTAQGAGVPGFTPVPNAASTGDGPCLLPGGATSTNTSAFRNAVAAMAPTAWDATQNLLLSLYPSPEPTVQWNIVGSGEYYLVPNTISPSIGYQLAANPSWVQPNCAGTTGCGPAPGTYQNKVNVYWETSDTVGVQEYTVGQADLAGIFTTHTPTLLQLVQQGKIQYFTTPSLSIFFWAFTLNFSASGLQGLIPSGDTFNIPTDFFSSVATRQLLVNSWPYSTYQNTINTVDGVQYGIQYGGVIPYGEGPFYPANVSWPAGDPVFNPHVVGSAAWWWAQGTNVSSPYYSSTLAACTVGNPCVYPIIGQLGNPGLDAAIQLYISDVEQATGGAITPYSFDIAFVTAVIASVSSAPFTSPLDFYTLGWIPDYPDPSNNIGAMWLANQTYTTSNSLYQQWIMPQYNSPSCGHSNYYAYANLTYWAGQTGVPEDCQGVAYQTLNYWGGYATHVSNTTQRILDYNLVSHIGNELALFVYFSQTNLVESSARWINQWSLNANVMLGGGGDNVFSQITYQTTSAATFTESGLTSGTSWSVTVGAQTVSSTSSTISVTLAPGSYPYTVNFVAGYTVTPVTGTITVTSSGASQAVTFTAFTSAGVAVTFAASGLVWGTTYVVAITNVGTLRFFTGLYTIALPAGSYSFTVQTPAGYNTSTPTGTFSAVVQGAPVNLVFTGVYFTTYPVTITASGLSAGTQWNAYVTGAAQASYFNSTSLAAMTFWELNGTTTFFTQATLQYLPPAGNITVNGAAVAHTAAFLPLPTVAYTFTESGLSSGVSWSVSINGFNTTGMASSLVINLPNGTFSYSVFSAGYTATPAGGTFSVIGVPSTQSITFSTPSSGSGSTSWTSLSTLAYIIIAVLAVLVVIFIVTTFMGRGGKPSMSAPPETWKESTPSTPSEPPK